MKKEPKWTLTIFESRGCLNCKAQKKIVDEVIGDYPHVEVNHPDEEDIDTFIQEHHITTSPTMILKCDGVETGRLASLRPASFVRTLLEGAV